MKDMKMSGFPKMPKGPKSKKPKGRPKKASLKSKTTAKNPFMQAASKLK